MKTKFAFFPIVLTIVLALPMFGQNTHDAMKKTDMMKHDMSSMMGKPTYETTLEGLHIKAWLMTQKEHKKIMKDMKGQMKMHEEMEDSMGHKGMKHNDMGMDKDKKEMKHESMGMDKEMKEMMMSGTHAIILDVTDEATGKETINATAKIQIVSPLKKNTSVDLKNMMNHFGSGLKLKEKGDYQLTVNITAGGVSKTTQFSYTVK